MSRVPPGPRLFLTMHLVCLTVTSAHLLRLGEVGGGDPLLDAPPAAEILEGSKGEDAGPITGEGLRNTKSSKVVHESKHKICIYVTLALQNTEPVRISIGQGCICVARDGEEVTENTLGGAFRSHRGTGGMVGLLGA